MNYLPSVSVSTDEQSCLFKFKCVSNFECFEDLKAGAQTSALKPTLKGHWSAPAVLGSSNSPILDLQTAFEGYRFEGTATDALMALPGC
jgi:hypothetical protein